MNVISAILIMFGLFSIGNGVSNGLYKVHEAILISNGYEYVCEEPWYKFTCEWKRAEAQNKSI